MSNTETKEGSLSELTLAEETNPISDYILSFSISDGFRKKLILILIIGNFLCLNLGTAFTLFSWYADTKLSQITAHLSEQYYTPIAVMYLVTGSIMIVSSSLGITAAVGGRKIENRAIAKSASSMFFIYWVAGIITTGTIIIAALIIFIEIHVQVNILVEIVEALMENYSKDVELKTAMDSFQMMLDCCGVDGYKDWYNISWVDTKYLDVSDVNISSMITSGKYYGQDVPFSCCKKNLTRPCVDTRIEDEGYHSKYNYPESLTLNTIGCKQAISNYLSQGEMVLGHIGLSLLLCILIWIVMTIIGRYLHTSLSQKEAGRPPIGWLIPVSN